MDDYNASRQMDLSNPNFPVSLQMLARALEDVMSIHYGIKEPIAGESRYEDTRRPVLHIGFGGEEETDEQNDNFRRFADDLLETLDHRALENDEEDEEEGMENPDVAYDLDAGILHARSVESFIDFFQTLSTLKGLGWDNFAPTPAPAGDPAPLKPSDRTKAERILQRKPDLLTAFQSEAGYARRDDLYRQILQMEKSASQRPRYSLNDIRRANAARPDSCARLWMN